MPVAFGVTGQPQILFHTDREPGMSWEIYRMKKDGSLQVNLSNNPAIDQFPAWAVGQSVVLFQSDRDGETEIYKMNADGGNVVQLTTNTAGDIQPAWSPSTGKVAFASNRDGDFEIWTMNLDGTNPTQVTINTGTTDLRPRWSPQADRIAYTSGSTIRIMDGNGGNNQLLTTGSDPDWSPDGTQLVYTCVFSGNPEICTISASGGAVTRLTTTAAFELSPVWAPYSSDLAVVSNVDHAAYEIYSLAATVGAPFVRLTNNTASDLGVDW
jgi:Tol biopolymer transport system component